jgi:acetolactate synthase-1/2/3 large subunit
VRTLERLGVAAAFGLPGSFILPLYDALERSSIRLISARHEQGAALMAEGYAMARGEPALCLATAGPGATNLVTGLACAWADSQPMLVIVGQVPAAFLGRGALQEAGGVGSRTVNQLGLLSHVCKGVRRVGSAAEVEAALTHAHHLATSGRPGPVCLELGVDVLNEAADWQGLPLPRRVRPASKTVLLAEVACRLLSADSPAVIAGAGVIDSGAAGLLLELAQALHLPVATTLKGKGALPEDHPLSLGCLGLFGHNAANRYLRGAPDLIVVLGAGLGEFSTQVYDPSLLAAPIIRFDIDPRPLPAPFAAALDVPGDIRQNLRRLLRLLPRRGAPQERVASLAGLKAATGHLNEEAAASDQAPMRPERLMAELRRALPGDALVFSESVTWTERYLPCLKAGTHRVGTGMAPIGFALPAALGAAAALPGRPVVAVMGDGGFPLNGLELLTAAHYGLPVIALVLNNGRYGSVFDAQTFLFGGRHVGSELPAVDLAGLAAALGVRSVRIEAPQEAGAAIEQALGAAAPVLVEAVIDPEARPPLKPRYLQRTKAWRVPGYTDSPTATQAIVGMLKEA